MFHIAMQSIPMLNVTGVTKVCVSVPGCLFVYPNRSFIELIQASVNAQCTRSVIEWKHISLHEMQRNYALFSVDSETDDRYSAAATA